MTDLTQTPEWREAVQVAASMLTIAWPEQDAIATQVLTAALPHLMELAARTAEGPEYWPHPQVEGERVRYRGDENHNWLAVKPPYRIDPYSQARADAAASILALSPKEPT